MCRYEWNLPLFTSKKYFFRIPEIVLSNETEARTVCNREQLICGSVGTLIWSLLKSNNLQISNFLHHDMNSKIINIQHPNKLHMVYFLDESGAVWRWENNLAPQKIEKIPPMQAIGAFGAPEASSENGHIYFVAMDGTLWCEGNTYDDQFLKCNLTYNGPINQVPGFTDVMNVFCGMSNVFLLCKNGRILWKPHGSRFENTHFQHTYNCFANENHDKTKFIEICPCSNVISIVGDHFLLDDGTVYRLNQRTNVISFVASDMEAISSYGMSISTDGYLYYSGEKWNSNEIDVSDTFIANISALSSNKTVIQDSNLEISILEKETLKNLKVTDELPVVGKRLKSARK